MAAALCAEATAPSGPDALWEHTGMSKTSARSEIFLASSKPPALGISILHDVTALVNDEGHKTAPGNRGFPPVRMGMGDSSVSLTQESQKSGGRRSSIHIGRIGAPRAQGSEHRLRPAPNAYALQFRNPAPTPGAHLQNLWHFCPGLHSSTAGYNRVDWSKTVL